MAVVSVAKAAKDLAKYIGVPVKDLTLSKIRNAKIPVRFKKLVQGVTSGEKKMEPSILSSRTVAKKEVQAASGAVSFTEGARLIAQYAKSKKEGTTQGRNNPRTPVKRAIKSAKKATEKPPTNAMPRPRKKPSDLVVNRSLRPKTRPKK
jgi:hypothetical protein